jgi:hypothetical protein
LPFYLKRFTSNTRLSIASQLAEIRDQGLAAVTGPAKSFREQQKKELSAFDINPDAASVYQFELIFSSFFSYSQSHLELHNGHVFSDH